MPANHLEPVLDPRALARPVQQAADRRDDDAGEKRRDLRRGQSRDPGGMSGDAAEGLAADVDAAVAAAVQAQKSWAKLGGRERGRMVQECGRLLEQHVEELARLITLETGKAIRTESWIEAGVFADVLVFYGGLGSELKGESVPFKPGTITLTQREPIGVVGAIIPWNFPLQLMALGRSRPWSSAIRGGQIGRGGAALGAARPPGDAGLPPGALNVLSGDGASCGAPLIALPRRRPRLVHRLGRDRPDHLPLRRRPAHPGDAGTGRQVPDDRHGRRRSRQGGRGRRHRHALHPPGPELHRGEPHLVP